MIKAGKNLEKAPTRGILSRKSFSMVESKTMTKTQETLKRFQPEESFHFDSFQWLRTKQ